MRRRPRGTGSVTASRDGFRARLPRRYGRRHVGTYATEDEAHDVLDALLEDLAARPPQVGDTVAEYGETWLAGPRVDEVGPRTLDRDRTRWRGRVAGTLLGRIAIRDLTEADVHRWLDGMRLADGSRPSATTRRNALSLLRAALDHARRHGVIAANPAAAVRLGRRATREAQRLDRWTWLRLEEIAAVLGCAAVPLHARAAWATAIYAGLRAGELWGLRWEDIDDARGTIHVRRSYTEAPKGGESRHVRILPQLRPWLDAWREADVYSPRGLVWPAVAGDCHAVGYDAGWARLRARAGVTRPVRFHDLRHTCASHLIQGSWAPEHIDRALRLEEVREWLGHSGIGVTQRYAHLSTDGIHALVRDPAPEGGRDTVGTQGQATWGIRTPDPRFTNASPGTRFRLHVTPDRALVSRPVSHLAREVIVAVSEGRADVGALALRLAEAVLADSQPGKPTAPDGEATDPRETGGSRG